MDVSQNRSHWVLSEGDVRIFEKLLEVERLEEHKADVGGAIRLELGKMSESREPLHKVKRLYDLQWALYQIVTKWKNSGKFPLKVSGQKRILRSRLADIATIIQLEIWKEHFCSGSGPFSKD